MNTYINTCLLGEYYRNIDEYIDRQINKYNDIYIYIDVDRWVDSQIYIWIQILITYTSIDS